MKKVSACLISLIVLISLFSSSVIVSASTTFSDVPRDHWAYNDIQFLSGKGVIKGSDGKFQPLVTLTKLDAAIMMARAMKLQAPSKPKMIPSDMKSTMRGYKEVIAAINLGMFTLQNKKFNPNQALSRQEMAKALAIGYGYKGSGKSTFRDVSKSNAYYTYIDAITENGIGSGYKDGTFKPTVTVNRAQFSVFLARIYSEPLEYTVKQNGKVLHKVRKKDEAIALALKYPKATVHPVSNSLMTYSDKTATMNKSGIKNGVLIYNGNENPVSFTNDFFAPYLVRNTVTNSGTMFDSFIILGRKYAGGEFAENSSSNKANYKEWKWYSDRTFASTGALANLNTAAKKVNKKVNVYISIPYPKRSGNIVDLNGKSMKNTTAEREKLVTWYMNTVQAKWNAAKYSNLVFKGYYWLNETVIHEQDELLVTNVAKKIHQQKKVFIYSPHALTTNFDRWQTYGLDGAFLQPNAFKTEYSSTFIKTRLHEAFINAQIHGSAINIEINSYSGDGMIAGLANFKQYVEMAERYDLPGRSLIMYQGTDMVYRMANYKQQPFQDAYGQLQRLIK